MGLAAAAVKAVMTRPAVRASAYAERFALTARTGAPDQMLIFGDCLLPSILA